MDSNDIQNIVQIANEIVQDNHEVFKEEIELEQALHLPGLKKMEQEVSHFQSLTEDDYIVQSTFNYSCYAGPEAASIIKKDG